MVKKETTLDKIEKLIVAGNKEVLDRLKKVESDIGFIKTDLGSVKGDVGSLKNDLGSVKKDIDYIKNDLVLVKKTIISIDKKHETNSVAMYDLLLDVRSDVRKASDKLEAHLKVPHAV